ncbi:MAG TPA: alpha-amylase family glycosyl hydrolase [Actinomycetota bacterium]|nr:alpha-amylase family glycosyl hydrolase [Actinomycetota bacterium]
MTPWWQRAVCYQVYVRSFADGDGDGIGDLIGLRQRLEHLSWLGVDAVWITPFYPSPMADHGYDVADYRDVDPLFGSLDDFDFVVDEAHRLGIRVIVDVVPNHTSDRHPWFVEALSSRDNPMRERYIFRDPAPDGSPPNNWGSVFGGPAWTMHEPTGQYWLHLFAPEQPDLNWRHPAVHEDFDQTLRFWLDRGVDGFRIDVAHALYKDEQLRDNPERPGHQRGATAYFSLEERYNWDQPEVHDVYRRWRRLLDSCDAERTSVGEVFLFDPARVADYVRPDELHLAFNFNFLGQPWEAPRFRDSITRSLEAMESVGAASTWVLSNHDVTRHATRYGGGEQGQRRARAAVLLLLGLPGTAFVYAGEELGLEEVELPDEARQDPVFFRTAGQLKGRDGCRVPIPWEPQGPGFGFTESSPWLPPPQDWGRRSVSSLTDDPESILHLYRRAISLRHSLPSLQGPHLRWLDTPPSCLAFDRGGVTFAANLGAEAVTLPLDGDLLLGSSPDVATTAGSLHLPPDTSAWIRPGDA